MQSRIEALYLSQKAMEQEVLISRATQPLMMSRPPRPNILKRLLMRFIPAIRQSHYMSLIRLSGLFDAEWYLTTYEDVAATGTDPLLHFLTSGGRERRNPGPYFDTDHYLHLYPDIVEIGMNPLLHYITAGFDEKRSIRPGMPHGGTLL